MELKDTVKSVGEFFAEIFGETPITQRLRDISGEATELSRFTSLANIKEESGDLLASLLALIHESGFDPEQLLDDNRKKILKRKTQYATLGRKVRVAILGGAFDPVHNGHISLAKFILNSSQYFDEVWLMPCFGHMYGKEMASAEHRIAMCKLASQEDLRIKVSDFEIKNQLRGETFQTAKLLFGSYEGKHCYEFAWIIGMDNANSAPQKWVNFAELERMMPFVVVPRIGETRDPKVRWYLQPPHLFLEPDNEKTISGESSTQIRKWIEIHKFCTDAVAEWLPRQVADYINQHKLYVPK